MGIAVITGSASGIGACVKARLEAQGYDVIGIDLKGAQISADLSTGEGRDAAISRALEMSEGKIERLVLAAGVGGHIENGQLVARVNYFGAINLLDGFKDALIAASGRVVVISSNSAQMRTDPESDIVRSLLEGNEAQALQYIGDSHGALIYGLSKHAVARAVRRRAAEWGRAGVTLNAIAPGQTETPMYRGAADHPIIGKSVESIPIPKTRVASADEIAGVIEFMLSGAADYMQGSIIYVDGGTDAQLRPDMF
jgi:NAD(P)-dependent dehydrogenase (short-subunit alcohol dehydrogenase family)